VPGPAKWQHRLHGHCARWTVPRQAVLAFLSRRPGHVSAKDIYGSLSDAYPGLGMTTIYRTLDLLERTGFIQRITLGDGQARYEFKPPDGKSHHHHLICTGCGRIIDYSDFAEEELDLVRKTEERLAKRHGFRIHDHNIEFLGLCEKCRAAGAGKPR
jgi:Fur family transcriptional regulator, ferric uptake regulator